MMVALIGWLTSCTREADKRPRRPCECATVFQEVLACPEFPSSTIAAAMQLEHSSDVSFGCIGIRPIG
jgi:hypothetical protein